MLILIRYWIFLQLSVTTAQRCQIGMKEKSLNLIYALIFRCSYYYSVLFWGFFILASSAFP